MLSLVCCGVLTLCSHYHHTEADTIDKVDPAKLTANVQLMLMMTYLLAEVEETLPRGAPVDPMAGKEKQPKSSQAAGPAPHN